MSSRHARRRSVRARLTGAVLVTGLIGGTTAAVVVPVAASSHVTGMHYHAKPPGRTIAMHYHAHMHYHA